MWRRGRRFGRRSLVRQDADLNVSLNTFRPPDHSGNGGIRGILLDGDTLVATGYTDGFEGGCLFINEEGTAMLWTFDLEGNLKQSKAIDIDTMAQGARVNYCCLLFVCDVTPQVFSGVRYRKTNLIA